MTLRTLVIDPDCQADFKHSSCAGGPCMCPCHTPDGEGNPRASHFVHHGHGWRNTRFMFWIDEQWRAFDAEHGLAEARQGAGVHHTSEHHGLFDEWLAARCPCTTDPQPYPRGAGSSPAPDPGG